MLAHEFKIQRERWGFSTALIAKILGVNERTVQRWESGRVEMTEQSAQRAEDVFAQLYQAAEKIRNDFDSVVTYENNDDMPRDLIKEFYSAKVHRAVISHSIARDDATLRAIRFTCKTK